MIMKHRTFPLKSTSEARVYVLQLLYAGLPFCVTPRTDRVDVQTPANLAEEYFPPTDWIKV